MLTDEQIAKGWIEHDGKGCPVPLEAKPAVLWGDGWITKAGLVEARKWIEEPYRNSWRHEGPLRHHIIAYRPEPRP